MLGIGGSPWGTDLRGHILALDGLLDRLTNPRLWQGEDSARVRADWATSVTSPWATAAEELDQLHWETSAATAGGGAA